MESTSNTVFIRLVTDVDNHGRGFEMKFSASKDYAPSFQLTTIRFTQFSQYFDKFQIVSDKFMIYEELSVSRKILIA